MMATAMSGLALANRDVAFGYLAKMSLKPVKETTTTPSDNPWNRLTQLVASNDRHMAELAKLNSRLTEANGYLKTISPNMVLGQAYRDSVKTRRSKVIAILRANRIAAQEFLSR